MSARAEILNEEFLKPLGLTAKALAKAIGVPPSRITAILMKQRGHPPISRTVSLKFLLTLVRQGQ